MRKYVSSIIMMICLLMAVPSQAQVKLGVKGGLNITKLKFSENAFKSDNKTGWFIGPVVDFKLPVLGLGFDVAALYTQDDLDFEVKGQNGTNLNETSGSLTQKTIQVPINVKFSIGLFYIAAGPQFGYNIGDKKIKEFYDEFKLKDYETSFNVGAGLRLQNRIQLGITYNFSMDEIDKDSQYELKKNTWQASVAFLF